MNMRTIIALSLVKYILSIFRYGVFFQQIYYIGIVNITYSKYVPSTDYTTQHWNIKIIRNTVLQIAYYSNILCCTHECQFSFRNYDKNILTICTPALQLPYNIMCNLYIHRACLRFQMPNINCVRQSRNRLFIFILIIKYNMYTVYVIRYNILKHAHIIIVVVRAYLY